MKTIKLHGILAKKFGKSFVLDVQSPKEACHAIASQIPAFRAFMLKAEQLGLKFAVFCGSQNKKNNITENELDYTTRANTIHIVPKMMGAGGKTIGWLQVIGGAVMVGVGLFTGNIALAGSGLGMALGGVASLLTPTPKIPNQDPDGNRPNKGFGGAVTTVTQGNPVPVLYGEREVGGFFASGGIDVY